MLPPDYFDHAADDLLELYSNLDETITRDIVRRLVKTGGVSATADWQIQRLQESGMLLDDIIRRVSQMTDASDQQVRMLFEDAGVKAVEIDRGIYQATGRSPPPLRQSLGAMQVLQAGMQKTAGHLRNLSGTTAIASQQSYINAVTLAEMQVESGAFDYVTAIRNAVRAAAESGAEVLYPTGHCDKLDVAIRRATLTGVSQTAAQISERYADDMGCDLVETTAHPGARPEHAVWQGKVFSRSGKHKKYPDFVASTGYGTGAGLCGWNCRHSFFPFFEGVSESAYPREKLQEYEKQTVLYNGETIKYYDATQMQRGMERQIRATKRELAGYDAGIKATDSEELRNALNEQFQAASVKLSRQKSQLDDFVDQTGILRQGEREQVLGFGHSQAQKAVHASKNRLFIQNDAANKASSGLPKKIDLPDEKIRRTVEVDLPKIKGVVPKGVSATEVYAMAGAGTGTPIRDLKRLYAAYPEAGSAARWQKKSGTVYTKNHKYVVHWYENNGFVPESEIKLKGAK